MQFDFIKRLFSPSPIKPREEPERVSHSIDAGLTLPTEAELIAESVALLTAAGAPGLAARVRVKWNSRMQSTAGMAYCARALVTLNPRLGQFGSEEIDRTLRHELGHLLAFERAGRRRIQPHGPEWRQACRDLGLPDEKRTHELPLPRRSLEKRYRYRCPACGIEMGRVKPLRRPSACLKCCRKHSGGRFDPRFKFVAVR